MKKQSIKHNKNWNGEREFTKKEKDEFEKKLMNRSKRIKKMTPEEAEKSSKILLNRNQKKIEIREQIISILQSTENLAIEDIRERLGINRNTFNYWVNIFEEEGWFERRNIEGLMGKDKRGQPKTLILNKKRIKERERLEIINEKSFEEKMLKSFLAEKILKEIDKQQPPNRQQERIIQAFKDFKKEGFGAKLMFLLSSDYIEIDYKLSLTQKGKKYLKKHSTSSP